MHQTFLTFFAIFFFLVWFSIPYKNLEISREFLMSMLFRHFKFFRVSGRKDREVSLSRSSSGPCPPELTPGNSAIDSLETSIGDLEQEEARGRVEEGNVARFSLGSGAYVYTCIGMLTLHVCDWPVPGATFCASETGPPITAPRRYYAVTKAISSVFVVQHPDLACRSKVVHVVPLVPSSPSNPS